MKTIIKEIKVYQFDELTEEAKQNAINKYSERLNFYYSRIQKENCCILTGMCYDDDFLKPIYDFVYNFREFPSANYQTFEDLIQYCFDSLKSSIESEIEYRESREAIEEEIQENCMEFTEDGNEF